MTLIEPIRYGFAASLCGVGWYPVLRFYPPTSGIFAPPGMLFPVESPLVPMSVLAITTVVVANALRRWILAPTGLIATSFAACVLGAALVAPCWLGLEVARTLVRGGAVEPLGAVLGGLAGSALFGLVHGLTAIPVALPYACLVVVMLRREMRHAGEDAATPPSQDPRRAPARPSTGTPPPPRS